MMWRLQLGIRAMLIPGMYDTEMLLAYGVSLYLFRPHIPSFFIVNRLYCVMHSNFASLLTCFDIERTLT